MASKKQKKRGFMLMYEKDGYYWGSYDAFPSKDDVKLIKVAVWRGWEEPDPDHGGEGESDSLTIEAQQELLDKEY